MLNEIHLYVTKVDVFDQTWTLTVFVCSADDRFTTPTVRNLVTVLPHLHNYNYKRARMIWIHFCGIVLSRHIRSYTLSN